MTQIRVTALISKTERMESESGRVAANVETRQDRGPDISDGVVTGDDSMAVATFQAHAGGGLSIQYNTDVDHAAILVEIEDYIAGVKAAAAEAGKGGEA